MGVLPAGASRPPAGHRPRARAHERLVDLGSLQDGHSASSWHGQSLGDVDGHRLTAARRRALLAGASSATSLTLVLLQPSASYSFIIRTETSNVPGTLGRVTTAIGDEGGDIGAIDIVRVAHGAMIRDVTVAARDEAHAQSIVERMRTLDGVTVVHVSDRTFLVHLGGKIEVNGRVPVKTRDDLSMVYTGFDRYASVDFDL